MVSNSSWSTTPSRRQLLAALGVGATGALAGCGSVIGFGTGAGTLGQTAKFVPKDSDEDDAFGESVALSADGSTAVVGADRDEDPNGKWAGSAYIFTATAENDGWTQQAKLAADDGEPHDFFGNSVAVSGDGTTVLVGAEDNASPDGLQTGAVYTFTP